MPGQLAAKIVEFGGTFHLPLGEQGGDALDAIGANDGTVVIGAGARNVAPLNDQGDGCITFDGSSSRVVVSAAAAINNIWDGGGSLFFMFNANGDGEGSTGRVFGKGGSRLAMQNESGAFVRLRFIVEWDGGANTDWLTEFDLPIGGTIVGAWLYDADTIGNLPTLYIHDGTGLTVRSDGTGLSRIATETGVRVDDSGSDLAVGNTTAAGATFDGEVDEFAIFNGVTLTDAEARELIGLALQEAPPPSGDPRFLDFPASTNVVVQHRVVAT